MKENYAVSFTKNDAAQARLVKAENAEQALAYFAEIEPAATVYGASLDQCNLERRGCPVEIVPDGWQPATSGGTDPEQEQAEQQDTTAIDGEDAPGRDVLGEVREYLDSLSDGEKVDIWNEYAEAANYPDNHIYSMDVFDEIFSDTKPWEIARACFYSRRFNPSDSWFWFNGYGNVESADYISDHDDRNPIYLDEVAEYIVSNDDELFNDDIRAILDGEEVTPA